MQQGRRRSPSRTSMYLPSINSASRSGSRGRVFLAGSENSDQIHSGNSAHPGVRPSGSRLAVESGEGKDAGHAEASRDSGATASGAQPAGGGKAGRGFREKRPKSGGRR